MALLSSEAREEPTGPCARWTTLEILLVFPMRDAHRVFSPDQSWGLQAKYLTWSNSQNFPFLLTHTANPSYQINIRSITLQGMNILDLQFYVEILTKQNTAVVQKLVPRYWKRHSADLRQPLSYASTASKVSRPGCPGVWLPPSEAFLISPTLDGVCPMIWKLS